MIQERKSTPSWMIESSQAKKSGVLITKSLLSKDQTLNIHSLNPLCIQCVHPLELVGSFQLLLPSHHIRSSQVILHCDSNQVNYSIPIQSMVLFKVCQGWFTIKCVAECIDSCSKQNLHTLRLSCNLQSDVLPDSIECLLTISIQTKATMVTKRRPSYPFRNAPY